MTDVLPADLRRAAPLPVVSAGRGVAAPVAASGVGADDGGRPVLLVPVPEPPKPDESGLPQVTLAFRKVAGEIVAEGFTTASRLVDARGAAQPWVAFSVADSITLFAGAGASVLLVDPGVEGSAVGVDLTCLAGAADGAAR